jgi:hypothetical protein
MLLRVCLVPHKKQNAKYQLFWNDGMQNTKFFRGIFSFIQNAELIILMRGSFGFFVLLRSKSKTENSYFCQKNLHGI